MNVMTEADHLRRGDIPIEVTVDIRFEPLERRYCARAEEFPDLMGLGADPEQASLELRELIYRWCTNQLVRGNVGGIQRIQ